MHPSIDFTFPTPASTASATATTIAQLPHPFKQEEENFSAGIFDSNDDHRRRRRNRTTQSCWSCHQAKRRCDRKRPCSRCIQLGLTGLCVYETDDPASRDDPTLSETQRLRNRIAELEKLVRELKNKPHPKWAGPGGMFKGTQNGTSLPNGTNTWPRTGDSTNGNAMDTDSTYPSNNSTTTASNYRFPPLNTLGVPLSLSLEANGNSASTNGASYTDPNGSYYLDNRRPSLVSNASTNTGTSSPRTPYMGYYPSSSSHHHNHYGYGSGSGLASNPCGCLSSLTSSSDESNMDMEDSNNGRSSSSTTVASRLARAIRSVILESGVAHPFAEGCKVLSLVRELENIASTNASASQSSQSTVTNGTYSSQTQTQQPQPQSTTTQGFSTSSYYSTMGNGTLGTHTTGHSPPPPSLTPSTSTTGTSASSPSSYVSHSHSHTHHHHPQQQQQQQHPHLTHTTHSHLGIASHHLPHSHSYLSTHHDSAERSQQVQVQTQMTNGYSSYATGYYSQPSSRTNGTTTSPSLSPPSGLTVLGVQQAGTE